MLGYKKVFAISNRLYVKTKNKIYELDKRDENLYIEKESLIPQWTWCDQ